MPWLRSAYILLAITSLLVFVRAGFWLAGQPDQLAVQSTPAVVDNNQSVVQAPVNVEPEGNMEPLKPQPLKLLFFGDVMLDRHVYERQLGRAESLTFWKI
jgi:hypothetical protein